MIIRKKTRFKPVYKQFPKLRENIQNSRKILKFKKQKWNNYVHFIKRTLKWYKRFKTRNQGHYTAILNATNRWTSYQQGRYRQILHSYKRFKLFYGGFNKKKIKKFIKQALNKNDQTKLKIMFLKLFESRLDVVLYRSKFSKSIRAARQFIVHKKIKVNNNLVKSQSYLLTPGDLISIDYKYHNLIENSIANCSIWPIPPKHLIINYKTLQIIFGTLDNIQFAQHFSFNLNLEKLLVDYLRH